MPFNKKSVKNRLIYNDLVYFDGVTQILTTQQMLSVR